jgi:serine/threonine-protein kinase HipA
MKLKQIEQVAVFYEPEQGRRTKVGRLALKAREILFEYDPGFLGSRLSLSPFKLPLTPGVVVGQSNVLDGLMGVFDDSLPDGWGRLLIDRRAAELGLSGSSLSPLDRLTLVGSRAMGALVYEPETAIDDPTIVKLSELARETEIVLKGTGGPDLERLIAVGGSPQGARPKVLIQLSPAGEVHFGARNIEPGFTAWLVKFRAPQDDRTSAALEHSYFLMAKAAGLDVPRTQILGKTKRDAGYFAIERFDRSARIRHHTHTVGGLLDHPHGYKAFDYRDLLRVTRRLTRNEAGVAEMFRRACFNVFARNRDDHTRNFAFIMNEQGVWQASPAYDLTLANGPGGEHTMLICGEGKEPKREHLLKLAEETDLKHGATFIDEVQAAINCFKQFADEAGVPAKTRDVVAKALGVSKGGKKKPPLRRDQDLRDP